MLQELFKKLLSNHTGKKHRQAAVLERMRRQIRSRMVLIESGVAEPQGRIEGFHPFNQSTRTS